jgi:hypothetical protein
MSINLLVVASYLINVWLRWPDAADISGAPMLPSLIHWLALDFPGWLGGKMVYVHGVAVAAITDSTTAAR